MKKAINNNISNDYRFVKFLFRSSQYLYILIQQKSTQLILPAMISDYNEQLQQIIKMFGSKLATCKKEQKHLVIPKNARREIYNGKKINLCIIQQKLIPLLSILQLNFKGQNSSPYQRNGNAPLLDLQQTKQQKQQKGKLEKQLKIMAVLQDVMRALYILHSNGIIHGRIALNTIYGQIQQSTGVVKFHLNLLDCISCFNKNQKFDAQEYLFRSEGQCFGITPNEKQDIESLVYLIVHLCSQQKMFSLEGRKKQIQKDGPMVGKWKTCFFYKAMIAILPERLLFLADLYLYLKTLDINDKPNYSFWLKKIQAQHRKFARLVHFIDQSSNSTENHNAQPLSNQQDQQGQSLQSINKQESSNQGNISDQQETKEAICLKRKQESLKGIQKRKIIKLMSSIR